MKRTYIIIIIMVLIPVIAAASLLAVLKKDAPAGEESALSEVSGAENGEESSEESGVCTHEYKTYWGNARYEENPTPGGPYGTETQICLNCGETLGERTLWYDERGIVYYITEDGCCAVRKITCDNGAYSGDFAIPDTVNGMPVTVLDTYLRTYGKDIVLNVPASVKLITEEAAISIAYCDLKIDETNPYYVYSGKCLIDKREKAVIMHSDGEECVIPADGSVTKIVKNGLYGVKDTVYIPACVTEIYCDACETSFDVTIEVDPANEVFTAAGNCLINKKTKTLVAGFKDFAIPRDGSVTRIGDYAFSHKGNNNVRMDYFIPACIEYIGVSAFNTLIIGKLMLEDAGAWCGIEFADMSAVPLRPYDSAEVTDANGRKIESVTVPENVTEINDYVFYGWKNLKEVIFHDNVTRIGDLAFCDTSLTEITLPENLRELGVQAFANCKLESVHLPAGVIRIGEFCFQNCPLKTLTAGFESNGVYDVRNGCLIDPVAKTLLLGCADSAIPDDGSVERIGERAFFGNPYLYGATIPEQIKYIEDSAFQHCINIKSAHFPAGLERVGKNAFSMCQKLEEVIFESGCAAEIGDSAFGGCPLKNVILPDKCKTIGYGAFEYWTPETLVIPDSVETVRSHAFSSYALTELHIGKGLRYMQQRQFPALKTLTVDPDNEYYFENGGYLISKSDSTLIFGCADSAIPDDGSVKAIGDHAFYAYKELEAIRIPGSVETVGEYAFAFCDKLKTVTPEEGVKTISTAAFAACSALEEIVLPKSLETVGREAFANCSSLKKVYAYSTTEFDPTAFNMGAKPEIIIIDNG